MSVYFERESSVTELWSVGRVELGLDGVVGSRWDDMVVDKVGATQDPIWSSQKLHIKNPHIEHHLHP